VPVYIVYFTVYERDGGLFFGNDLYDRDDALVAPVNYAEPDSGRRAKWRRCCGR